MPIASIFLTGAYKSKIIRKYLQTYQQTRMFVSINLHNKRWKSSKKQTAATWIILKLWYSIVGDKNLKILKTIKLNLKKQTNYAWINVKQKNSKKYRF